MAWLPERQDPRLVFLLIGKNMKKYLTEYQALALFGMYTQKQCLVVIEKTPFIGLLSYDDEGDIVKELLDLGLIKFVGGDLAGGGFGREVYSINDKGIKIVKEGVKALKKTMTGIEVDNNGLQ